MPSRAAPRFCEQGNARARAHTHTCTHTHTHTHTQLTSSSKFTHSRCPLRHASCKGVMPARGESPGNKRVSRRGRGDETRKKVGGGGILQKRPFTDTVPSADRKSIGLFSASLASELLWRDPCMAARMASTASVLPDRMQFSISVRRCRPSGIMHEADLHWQRDAARSHG